MSTPPPGGDGPERRRRGPRASPEGSSAGTPFVAEEAAAAAAAGDWAARAAVLEASYHGVALPLADVVPIGAPGCQRCEVIAEPPAGPGTLHLHFPHTHTLGKALALLVHAGHPHAERDGTVRVAVPTADVAAVLAPLAAVLTSTERRDVRALFQRAGRVLDAGDYFEAEPVAALLARAEGAWLVELLRAHRLRSVFQPIADAATVDAGGAVDPTDAAHAPRFVVHGYECLMRGTRADGREAMPGAMLDVAREGDLTFALDLAARRSAILAAARHDIRQRVFVNFTPHAIYDPQSCLRSTVALVDEVGLRREQVVFEVVETERFEDLTLLGRIADYYRERGFGVALDDVGAGYASLNALVALRPDYAKLDMGLTRGVDRDPVRAVVAAKVLEAARELGIRTVVEGVETAAECRWAVDHGADYVQGYYVARPAAPPPAPAP
jgi:EAL domain-containing protein (putative c-di-GMP-specific phosphodiesterase class I)